MSSARGTPEVGRDYLTIADLVAMPHLGLQLVAGGGGDRNRVHWTHVSELADPGPWLEGGELLIVNGLGIPDDAEGQVRYIAGLARHRLAGLVISVRAPALSEKMITEANRLSFPVLRIPREIPFIELSYLVASASERAVRGRLARHLRIFDTLRLRNGIESDIAKIYSQLEQVSGYRLALVSPAGRPLLSGWPWVPDDLDLGISGSSSPDLHVTRRGYVIPLFVGSRVTAYLVGMEHADADPGGLAALQNVSMLAALDAVEDQRRREVRHREGSALLAAAFDEGGKSNELAERFNAAGLDPARGVRLLAIVGEDGGPVEEIWVRDWLTDRGLSHLLLRQEQLLAVVGCDGLDLNRLANDLRLLIGASATERDLGALARMRSQALWALRIAYDPAEPAVILAENQVGLARWLTPDMEMMRNLVYCTLHPIVAYDTEHGTTLQRTLTVYFQQQGRVRQTAQRLFVHEHTLIYRLKRIEKLTGRSLKSYRDTFELWLATEASALIEEP
ncbi:PucR family transcriptional regulator [Nocardia amamiensis]|uniref:PucR family transcriptional regulator n=1 Tax=Nocardia amamiensis TaxID=404578 RepID=UPI000832210F|nr:PucR family transcriptional regulator [Nocardia amamiensis]